MTAPGCHAPAVTAATDDAAGAEACDAVTLSRRTKAVAAQSKGDATGSPSVPAPPNHVNTPVLTDPDATGCDDPGDDATDEGMTAPGFVPAPSFGDVVAGIRSEGSATAVAAPARATPDERVWEPLE